jgi:hypothetical protein
VKVQTEFRNKYPELPVRNKSPMQGLVTRFSGTGSVCNKKSDGYQSLLTEGKIVNIKVYCSHSENPFDFFSPEGCAWFKHIESCQELRLQYLPCNART